MQKRRSGRELAFKLLFQIDLSGANPGEVFEVAREGSEASSTVWVFAIQLARGTWEKHAELDAIIEKYASGWTLERMANADRNLLRLALYEMVYRDEIPTSVSVNEAVELAKEYSTQDSPRFINGILGAYLREKKPEEVAV